MRSTVTGVDLQVVSLRRVGFSEVVFDLFTPASLKKRSDLAPLTYFDIWPPSYSFDSPINCTNLNRGPLISLNSDLAELGVFYATSSFIFWTMKLMFQPRIKILLTWYFQKRHRPKLKKIFLKKKYILKIAEVFLH